MERIQQLQQFLKDKPADSFLKHALALEYSKLNDHETARRLFEEVLTNDPGYVGSYYHLAKLLEHTGHRNDAIKWYEKGMKAAKQAGDHHALGELRSAYEELLY